MHDYLYSVSLGLLYVFVVISPGFFIFVLSVLAKRLAGKSVTLRNDLYCVEWNVKPELNQSIPAVHYQE